MALGVSSQGLDRRLPKEVQQMDNGKCYFFFLINQLHQHTAEPRQMIQCILWRWTRALAVYDR